MSQAGDGWPPGSRSRTEDLGGGTVRLTEYGDRDSAKVMVCLHGLGGSGLNFGLVAPLLSRRGRVLVPDLLAHGRSFTPDRSQGALAAQLHMLSELLEHEADSPVVLVGHSMGGILAMLHTARRPDQVARLVLIDPPVPNVTRWSRDPRLTAKLALLRLPGMNALVARQVLAMTPEQLVARQLSDATPYVDRVPRAASDATVAEIRETRAEGGRTAAQKAQFQAILDVIALLARPGDWRRQLAAITVPTLWLQGEDDPLAAMRGARALAASRPDWTFRSRSGVGHLPHLEDPVWTAEVIERWLGEEPTA